MNLNENIGIYKITNIDNGKIYIGKTINGIKKRFEKHLKCAKNNKKGYLYNAIRYHGFDKFIVETLEYCDEKILNDREKYWIDYYKSNDSNIGYNLTDGGDGGKLNEESRKKISEKHKGKKLTEEHKQKISQGNIGKIKGPCSEERKNKIRNSHILNGHTWPKLDRNNKNNGMFSKHHTNETKQKMSIIKKGKPTWIKGNHLVIQHHKNLMKKRLVQNANLLF